MSQEDVLQYLREPSVQHAEKLDKVVTAVNDLKSAIGERVAIVERDVAAVHNRVDCTGKRMSEITDSLGAEIEARQKAVAGAEGRGRAFVIKLLSLVTGLVVLGLSIAAVVR